MHGRKLLKLCSIILVAGFVASCTSPQGENVTGKRKAVQDMRRDTLAKLYQIHPDARERINKSVGYAVFSNVGINLIFVSAGNGWGVVRDNRNRKDVYMKMASAGLGIGLGAKDFRGVFVFTKRDALNHFIEEGWDASGQADAAAKAGKKGGAFAGAVDVAPGIWLYQITEHGLALQATVQGTKYWKDDELNL